MRYAPILLLTLLVLVLLPPGVSAITSTATLTVTGTVVAPSASGGGGNGISPVNGHSGTSSNYYFQPAAPPISGLHPAAPQPAAPQAAPPAAVSGNPAPINGLSRPVTRPP